MSFVFSLKATLILLLTVAGGSLGGVGYYYQARAADLNSQVSNLNNKQSTTVARNTTKRRNQQSPIARIVVPNSTGFSQCAASFRPGRNHSASSSDIATPDPTGERTLSFRKNDHYWRAS